MANQFAVQYAFVTVAASGATTIVAAQASQRIIVLQCCVITGAADNVKFQSSGGSDLTALFPLAANGGFVLPYSQAGWFQTVLGEGLNFSQSATTSCAVQVVWCPANQ